MSNGASGPARRKGRMVEAGVAGNTDYHGWGGGGEYLRNLTGQRGMLKYDEMRRSDAQVKSLLQAIKLPIRRATWRVEPPKEASSEDETIADTIQKNLMERMSTTFDDFIRHALLMLDFGYSPVEKVWMIEDGLVMLKELAARLPYSIKQFVYNKAARRLEGLIQVDTDMDEYFLPIEKLLIFTADREGDDWEGTSILRPVYKPWFIKNDMEKINAVKHERHGVGVPIITVPDGATPGTDQWDAAEDLARSLVAHENAYGIKQASFSVEILGQGTDQKGTDGLPTIKYYDEQIVAAGLAMFLKLGMTQTGSRALGGSFLDVFMQSLQAMADYICEIVNRFLIRQWVDWNWQVEEYPKLTVSRIKELDAQTIQMFKNAGLLTADFELEQFIRAELRLPEKDEEEYRANQEAMAALRNKIGVATDEDEDGNGSDAPDKGKGAKPGEQQKSDQQNPEDKEKKNSGVTGRRILIAGKPEDRIVLDPKKAREHVRPITPYGEGITITLQQRDLTPEEKLVDISGIEIQLNEAQGALVDKLTLLKNKQIEAITRQLVGGTPRIRLSVPYSGEMYSACIAAYKAQVEIGRRQVREEVQRQVPGVTLADPGAFTKEDLLRFAEEELSIMVEGAGNKLASLLATWANDLRRQGLQGSALEDALRSRIRDRLSNSTWDGLAASSVNKGWGAGRALAILALQDEGRVEYCYYSAILDNAVCSECLPKDGQRHAADDPEYITPNPDCLGGSRCRCITIVVLNEESNEA